MSEKGKLSGEPAQLVNLLAQIMQSKSPIFAISELVQNGLDANAQNINIYIKKKDRRSKVLVDEECVMIEDDGHGFLQSFENYTNNIGDSIKTKYEEYLERKKRGENIGEFCLGILSFGSVGEELEIVNLTESTKEPKLVNGAAAIDDDYFSKMKTTRMLTLTKGEDDYEILNEEEISIKRDFSGVTYTIRKLLEEGKREITAKRLNEYLSYQKGNQLLKRKGVKIKIHEGRKVTEVKPARFRGKKLSFTQSLPGKDQDLSKKGYGDIKLELFIHEPGDGRVSITKNGNPVVNINELSGFNTYPWNSGMLDGTIEYDRCTISPMRGVLERDNFYDAMLSMIKTAEVRVKDAVKDYEGEIKSKEDKNMMAKLNKVFSMIKKEIDPDRPWFDEIKKAEGERFVGSLDHITVYPTEENIEAKTERQFIVHVFDGDEKRLYASDDITFGWEVVGNKGEIKRILGDGERVIFKTGSIRGEETIKVTVKQNDIVKTETAKIMIVFPTHLGSLDYVKIRPNVSDVIISKEKELKVLAFDKNGKETLHDLNYRWQIVNDESAGATIEPAYTKNVVFTPGKQKGSCNIMVEVKCGKVKKVDSAIVVVLEEQRIRDRPPRNIVLPKLKKEPDSLTIPMWHSRLTEDGKLLEYNTEHPHYKQLTTKNRRHHYIAKLYAKELAIKQSKAEQDVNLTGEKFLDVLVLLDRYWK